MNGKNINSEANISLKRSGLVTGQFCFTSRGYSKKISSLYELTSSSGMMVL